MEPYYGVCGRVDPQVTSMNRLVGDAFKYSMHDINTSLHKAESEFDRTEYGMVRRSTALNASHHAELMMKHTSYNGTKFGQN